jgi:hypothetical protein
LTTRDFPGNSYLDAIYHSVVYINDLTLSSSDKMDLGSDVLILVPFKRKGDLSKAKENLSKAIEILKECRVNGWAEKYEKEMASLS